MARRVLPIGISLGVLAAMIATAAPAQAAGVPGDPEFLDTAASFSVIGGSTVTNTGSSVLDGSLAVSPGSALPGFPPGLIGGSVHSNDAVAIQAQIDLVTAANALMAVPAFDVGTADLDGLTFLAGAYSSASSLLNNGTITLQGDADDVFIFTAVSTLTTGAGSTIAFIGDVQECNVFWRIGSSATLGAGSHLAGTVIAQASVSATTSATIAGRLFAQTAAVTLQSNVFTAPSCDTAGGDGTVIVPEVVPPVDTPGGPTGPVLEVPDDVVPGDEETPGDDDEDLTTPAGTPETLAATGAEGTSGIVVLGALLVALGMGSLAWTGRRRRGNLLGQQDVG